MTWLVELRAATLVVLQWSSNRNSLLVASKSVQLHTKGISVRLIVEILGATRCAREYSTVSFRVNPCWICGDIEFKDKMLEYNDHMFCGIICKLKQERKDNENLVRLVPRSVGYYDKG